MFDDLLSGSITCRTLTDQQALKNIREKIHLFEDSHKDHKTALLWFQYLHLVEMLQRFITAERTGNWCLHLQTLKEMLPYFAATGHNNYTKSSHVYLQQMLLLENANPTVHKAFVNGHHVIRRSDRFWGGLSTDLVIEQVLMRSVKATGGLTRGRGLSEEQRAKWLMSMPQCALINEAMQNITSTNYETSDQHKESGPARRRRDDEDITCFAQFLMERNPFSNEKSLRNIETGVTGEPNVNVYEANEVGVKILQLMNGSKIDDFVFKKKNQVVTLGCKSSVKVNEKNINIDPQMLFQRLVAASQNLFPDISELFTYELSGSPPSMFESSGLMRTAQKSQLADSIWSLGDCSGDIWHTTDIHHILDGGSLLHRLPWSKGSTFQNIINMYVDLVQKFSNPTVVFDGYSGPSPKDSAHMHRTKGLVGTRIHFSPQTPFRSRKESFLTNLENKTNFLEMLSKELEKSGVKTIQASNDADVDIAIAALDAALENRTVVIGEDTDLLILLIYLTDSTRQSIQFRSDQCRQSMPSKIWDIQKTQNVLGEEICHLLPSLHALTGCDTTSRLFGIGKSIALKKLRESCSFRALLTNLSKPNLSYTEVEKTGEEAISLLYGGLPYETLDTLRYRRFALKALSNSVSLLHINTLPPTSAAAKYHCFRVYCQTMEWTNEPSAIKLNPLDWGWELSGGKMEPVKTHLPAAPEKLLQIIHCNCKGDCTSKRCTCRKHGIDCSDFCGECRENNCSNRSFEDAVRNDDI